MGRLKEGLDDDVGGGGDADSGQGGRINKMRKEKER